MLLGRRLFFVLAYSCTAIQRKYGYSASQAVDMQQIAARVLRYNGASQGWGCRRSPRVRIRIVAWWRWAWLNGSPSVLIMRGKQEIACKGKLPLWSGLGAEGLDKA